MTSGQIQKKLERYGISVCSSTVRRMRKKLGWTLQKTAYCQLIQAPNKVKRLEYARSLLYSLNETKRRAEVTRSFKTVTGNSNHNDSMQALKTCLICSTTFWSPQNIQIFNKLLLLMPRLHLVILRNDCRTSADTTSPTRGQRKHVVRLCARNMYLMGSRWKMAAGLAAIVSCTIVAGNPFPFYCKSGLKVKSQLWAKRSKFYL